MSKFEKLNEINAISLYVNGKTLKEIASIADCAESTVSLYLHNNSVQVRSTGILKTLIPVGTKVGPWVVIDDLYQVTSHRTILQHCKCSVCGLESYVALNNPNVKNSHRCGKCKNSKTLDDEGNPDINYIFNFLYHHICKNLNRRSKVSKLEFNITPEYLQELYFKLGGKCALSGIDLPLKVIKTADLILSLDRINSDIGYIKSNVQWIHKDINMMKQSYDCEYFIKMCKTIAIFQESDKISECGGELVNEMGCVTCRNCGYSRCG